MMLLSMVTSSLILVTILDFDEKRSVVGGDITGFADFWITRCDKEWRLSFLAFMYGVPIFLISLGLLGFLKFQHSTATHWLIAVVAAVSIAIFFLYTRRNWGQLGTASAYELPPLPEGPRPGGGEEEEESGEAVGEGNGEGNGVEVGAERRREWEEFDVEEGRRERVWEEVD